MLVFTFATPDIADYADKSGLINQMYCRKNKYKWHSDNQERLNSDWDKQWEKVAMSLDMLRETKEGEWLCWIDADAAFNHHDVRLQSFIKQAGNKDFLICHDGVNRGDEEEAKDPHFINTGVMIFKNTPWVRDLFQRWIRTPGKYKKGSNTQDQERLVEMYRANELGMKDHIKVFPANAFNSSYGRPNADTFVVHMMSRSTEERVDRFNGILEKLNRRVKDTPDDIVKRAFESRQQGKNVAIVTMYDNKIANYAHLSALINSMYAAKHGYEMVTIRKRISDRAPQWDKVLAVKEVMAQDTHEYIMWIDADAIFNDFDTDLVEKIIKPSMSDETDIIICDDTCNKPKELRDGSFFPNTGTFVFRNSDWSKEFIENWWNNPGKKKFKKYHEQDQLKTMYEENVMGLQSKLKLLPARTMNSCFEEIPNSKNINVRKGNTLIVHMMGTDNKIREKYFRNRYNALLKENPEYLTHYNDRTSMQMETSENGNYEATVAFATVVVLAIAIVLLILAFGKKSKQEE